MKSKKIFFFIFILPALLFYTFFFIFPFVQGVCYSFTDWNGIKPDLVSKISAADVKKITTDEKIPTQKRVDFLETVQKHYKLERENYLLIEWRDGKQITGSEKKEIKSVLNSVGVRNINFIGFDNYKKMFTNDKRFLGSINFTIFFTVFNVLFTNIIALLLAVILDRGLRKKNLLRSMFFMPNVLSLVIVAFIWTFIFQMVLPHPSKVLGFLLPQSAFRGAGGGWLTNIFVAPISVVIVTVWQGAGYIMLIYLAGLQSIPDDILEVASIDGANKFQKFIFITLPLLIPSFTISLFLTLSNSLKTFDVIFALTKGDFNTTNIVVDVYNTAFSRNEFGYGTAKAIILCIVIMIITSIQLSLMKRKEVEL